MRIPRIGLNIKDQKGGLLVSFGDQDPKKEKRGKSTTTNLN